MVDNHLKEYFVKKNFKSDRKNYNEKNFKNFLIFHLKKNTENWICFIPTVGLLDSGEWVGVVLGTPLGPVVGLTDGAET